MCRPEIAGWSITMSHPGWRQTTVTGLESSTSVTIALSRLTTTRADIVVGYPVASMEDLAAGSPRPLPAPRRAGSVASIARGRGIGGLELVVEVFHAFDRGRDLRRRVRLALGVDHAGEREAPRVGFDGDAGAGGASVAAQRGANAPFEREVVDQANRLGGLLGAPLPHHALRLLDAFVGGEDRQARLVGGEPLPDARLAVEEALHMALAQPHLVGDRLDDLVVDHAAVGALGHTRGDVLAQGTHLASHGDQRHWRLPS